MEEIIIDGVCINNCEYGKIIPYDYPTSGIDIECYIDYQNEITKDCKENHNCLYKQLKRLEQENKNLKEELATERLYNSQIEEFEESLHKLKEENEEYIQTIQKFMDNAGIECDDDEQELRTLPNAGTCLFKLRLENDDLKQTIKDLTQSLDDCNVQRTQLKKENEEFKEVYISRMF